MRNQVLLGMIFALQAQSVRAELCSNFYRYFVKAPASFIDDRGEKAGRSWLSLSNKGCRIYYNNDKHRISCNIYVGPNENESKSNLDVVKDDLSTCLKKSGVDWKSNITEKDDDDFKGRTYTWSFSSDKGVNEIKAEYYLDKGSEKYFTFISASFRPDS